MEELAIFDSNGNLVNKTIKRNEDIKRLEKDFYIAVCVIYIENDDGKFLMQKTSLEKGNEYSSTGSHVLRGETPREAIIREVLEELGIDISNDKVEECGYLHYDRVLRYVFYLKKVLI